MNKKVVAISLGLMCFALTIAILVQYRTIVDSNKIIGSSASGELKTEVLKWKEKYEEVYKKLEEQENLLETKRELATNNDEASLKLQKELKTLNALIGAIDVTGNGVIITVADNKNITNQNIEVYDNISNYLIHDWDLIKLVNELKNAGAEAISINDERIINTTAITCDGNVILINGNKLSSPFTIKVIGSQATILGAIQRPGGFLEFLNSYGLVASVEQQNNITIYRHNGIIE